MCWILLRGNAVFARWCQVVPAFSRLLLLVQVLLLLLVQQMLLL
jgi:hypothetical protein